jgi:hypothetical protein
MGQEWRASVHATLGGATAAAVTAGHGPRAEVLAAWLAFAAGSRGKEMGQEWRASVHAALGGATAAAATAASGPPAEVLAAWLAFVAGSRGKETGQEWWASMRAALEASRQRVAAGWLVRPAVWILRRSKRFYIRQEPHLPVWFKKRIKTAARFAIRRFRIAV